MLLADLGMPPLTPVASTSCGGAHCGGLRLCWRCRSHMVESCQALNLLHEFIFLVGRNFIHVPVTDFNHSTLIRLKVGLVTLHMLSLRVP